MVFEITTIVAVLLVLDLLVGSGTARGAVAGDFRLDAATGVGGLKAVVIVFIAVELELELELVLFVLWVLFTLDAFVGALLARGGLARGTGGASSGALGRVRVSLAEFPENFLGPLLVCS